MDDRRSRRRRPSAVDRVDAARARPRAGYCSCPRARRLCHGSGPSARCPGHRSGPGACRPCHGLGARRNRAGAADRARRPHDPSARAHGGRPRSDGGGSVGHASVDRHWMARAVVRMVIGRVPMPGSVVAESHIDTPRSIVAGHEPPHARVVVPARLHEDVVHALDDAVPVDPNVITVAVGPVAVDPDRPRALHLGLHDHDRLRRRRRLLRGCQGLGLLNDDHRLAVDDLGGAVLSFDDHVGRRVGRCARLAFSLVAVVRDIEPRAGRAAIAVCTVVVGSHGAVHATAAPSAKSETNRTRESMVPPLSVCPSGPFVIPPVRSRRGPLDRACGKCLDFGNSDELTRDRRRDRPTSSTVRI